MATVGTKISSRPPDAKRTRKKRPQCWARLKAGGGDDKG